MLVQTITERINAFSVDRFREPFVRKSDGVVKSINGFLEVV